MLQTSFPSAWTGFGDPNVDRGKLPAHATPRKDVVMQYVMSLLVWFWDLYSCTIHAQEIPNEVHRKVLGESACNTCQTGHVLIGVSRQTRPATCFSLRSSHTVLGSSIRKQTLFAPKKVQIAGGIWTLLTLGKKWTRRFQNINVLSKCVCNQGNP